MAKSKIVQKLQLVAKELLTEELGVSPDTTQAGVSSLNKEEPTSGNSTETKDQQVQKETEMVDYETSGMKAQREKRRKEREAEKAQRIKDKDYPQPEVIVYPSLAQEHILEGIKRKEKADKAFMTNVPTQARAGDAPIAKEVFAELIGIAQQADRKGTNKEWRESVNRLKLSQAAYFQAWEQWDGKEKFSKRDAQGRFVESTPPEPQGKANHGISMYEVMHQKSLIQAGGTLEVEATKKKWVVETIGGQKQPGHFREPLKLIPVDSKEDEMAGKAYQNGDPFWHEIGVSHTEGLSDVRSNQKWLEDSMKDRMAKEANIEMEIPQELQEVALQNLPNPWGPFDPDLQGFKWWVAPKSELHSKLELKSLICKLADGSKLFTFNVNSFGREVKGTSEKPDASWIAQRGALALSQGWYSKKAIDGILARNPGAKYNQRKLEWQLGLYEQGRFCGHYQTGDLYAGIVQQIHSTGKDLVARHAEQGPDAVTNYLFQRLSLVKGSLMRRKPVFVKNISEGQEKQFSTAIHGHFCFCNKEEERFEVLKKVGLAETRGKYRITPHIRDEGNHVYLQEKLLGHKPQYKFSGWSGAWRCVFCGTHKAEKSIQVKVGSFLRPNSDDYWVATFEVSGPILKQLLWALDGHETVSTYDPYLLTRQKGTVQKAVKYVPNPKRSFASDID